MPAPGDLIHQQSTSTGTGNFTVSAVNGKRSFNDEYGTGGTDKFDYYISNQAAAEWERGTGHLSASSTLVRDTVIASSNANVAVSFSAGLKDICNDIPAAKQVSTDGTQTLTNKTLTNPIVGTQSQGDNSTKAASTAYVDRTTREVLTANRTYYVDKTLGSNSNTGLTSGAGAFSTIQKAIDTACALDLSVYKVTINLADGTGYAGFNLKKYVGVGPIEIIGNTTTPANVDLSGAATNVGGNGWSGAYTFKGAKIANSAGNGMGLVGPGSLTIDKIEFGACSAAHIRADNSCFVTCLTGALTISGNAAYGWLSGYLSVINLDSSTVTYTANVAYSQAHCYAQMEGLINVPAVTWTLGGNTVTGKRYNAYANATINTSGGGATFIPGDVAGTTTGDGVYN